MTRLVWDELTERVYFAGVDRGVIYPTDESPPVVWNGLTAVTDNSASELKQYYYDGRAALVRIVPREFSGKIEAITYPAVLDELTGAVSHAAGIRVHNSLSGEFHMTYRTLIGTPGDGTDHGYRIHLLYGLKASFDDIVANTLSESIEPANFSWTVTSVVRFVKNNLALTHLSLDSREIDSETLADLEDQLYGTDSTAPAIPDPRDLIP